MNAPFPAFLMLVVPALAWGELVRKWDQEAAEQRVEEVLAREAEGEAWNEIEWLEDPDEAARRAAEENRPIFLYFYLKTAVGPTNDPG